MRQSIRSKAVLIISLATAFLSPILALAQDPGPGPDVPIDGGLSLLVAAGVGYGVKKIREERKKNKKLN